MKPGDAATQLRNVDKLQDKNKTQPDVDRIGKTIASRSSIQSLLKRIDTVAEFRDLVLAIFNQKFQYIFYVSLSIIIRGLPILINIPNRGKSLNSQIL